MSKGPNIFTIKNHIFQFMKCSKSYGSLVERHQIRDCVFDDPFNFWFEGATLLPSLIGVNLVPPLSQGFCRWHISLTSLRISKG